MSGEYVTQQPPATIPVRVETLPNGSAVAYTIEPAASPEERAADEAWKRYQRDPDRSLDIEALLAAARVEAAAARDEPPQSGNIEQIQAALLDKASEVSDHVQDEVDHPERAHQPVTGYREIAVGQTLIDDLAKRGLAIPHNLQISKLLEQRLSRDQWHTKGKSLIVNDLNLAAACERANIEYAGDIILGSLEFDEEPTPEVELGVVDEDGKFDEGLDEPITTASIEIDPAAAQDDAEAIHSINRALYTAILLTDRLGSNQDIEEAVDELDDELDSDRNKQLGLSLGFVATSVVTALAKHAAVLPPHLQMLASSVAAGANAFNIYYGIAHPIPNIDKITDHEIIDLLESEVRADAELLATKYPVIDFDVLY